MPVRSVTPILNVSNVEASVDWFGKLGWRVGFLWPNDGQGGATFGSVCSGAHEGGAEIFLCLGAQGSRGTIMPNSPGDDRTDGVWMSWWVDTPTEVDALHASCLK